MAAKAEASSSRKKIAFGAQSRSYIMHPYHMVRDERTNHKTHDVQHVLDGYIDPFIEAMLLQKQTLVATKRPPS